MRPAQIGPRFCFDATTRRQVPFSAVVISLMGDDPGTIDPIIVFLCVILEDETSETQVDGIVTKVRTPISHTIQLRCRVLIITTPCKDKFSKKQVGENTTSCIA